MGVATACEFRYRFFFIAAIFCAGFMVIAFLPNQVVLAERLANVIGLESRRGIQGIFFIGGLITAAAAMIRTWAAAYLKSSVVHDMAMHSNRLVADGPYRFVRNPLYLGLCLLAVGYGLMMAWPGSLFLVICITVFNLRLIAGEEAALAMQQGESFLSFKRAVPRLLPSLTPRLPAGTAVPNWTQAWKAESFMWMFAVAMLGFAATLDQHILFGIMGTSLLGYAVLHVLNSRRQERARRLIL